MFHYNQGKNQEVQKETIFKKTEIKSFVDLGSKTVTEVKRPNHHHVNIEDFKEPVYITTEKPLINSVINIGQKGSVNSVKIKENKIVETQYRVTLKPFVYIVTTAATTTKTPDTLLSTESYFMKHNKIQEISLAEGDPITPPVKVNSFTQFKEGNFHNFMHNFGSTIDQVLFSDQNHSDAQLSGEQQSDKYFSLFKEVTFTTRYSSYVDIYSKL